MKPICTPDDQTRIALVQRAERAEAERDRLRGLYVRSAGNYQALGHELKVAEVERDQLREDYKELLADRDENEKGWNECVRDLQQTVAERDQLRRDLMDADKQADVLVAERDQLRKERDEWERRYEELLASIGGTWPG